MDSQQAHELAVSLMAQHGLSDWHFGFDRAKKRAGQTNFRDSRITLSQYITAGSTTEQVRDTILHEIAHALVGPQEKHGPKWREQAKKIGATPRASMRGAPQLEGIWVGTCPNGHVIYRHRRPTRPTSCGVCFPRRYSHTYAISWHNRRTGERLS